MKVKNVVLLALVVAIIALAAGTLLLVRDRLSVKDSNPVVKPIDIEGTIRDIGELATAEYGFSMTQITEKPAKEVIGFKIPGTTSRVIYSYEGIIKAGIDFQEVKVTRNEPNKKIYIELPESRILSTEVDNDSLTVYDEQNSPFNSFSFSDLNLSLAELKETAEKNATERGLLQQADDNAQRLIRSAIGGLYDAEEYSLEFVD